MQIGFHFASINWHFLKNPTFSAFLLIVCHFWYFVASDVGTKKSSESLQSSHWWQQHSLIELLYVNCATNPSKVTTKLVWFESSCKIKHTFLWYKQTHIMRNLITKLRKSNWHILMFKFKKMVCLTVHLASLAIFARTNRFYPGDCGNEHASFFNALPHACLFWYGDMFVLWMFWQFSFAAAASFILEVFTRFCSLKLVSANFSWIFIFSSNDRLSKTMKNVYFIKKALFILEIFL